MCTIWQSCAALVEKARDVSLVARGMHQDLPGDVNVSRPSRIVKAIVAIGIGHFKVSSRCKKQAHSSWRVHHIN